MAKGSLIHTHSYLAHTGEDIWGTLEHPVDQLWPERHIKYVETKDQKGQLIRKREFVMASLAFFFPFDES